MSAEKPRQGLLQKPLVLAAAGVGALVTAGAVAYYLLKSSSSADGKGEEKDAETGLKKGFLNTPNATTSASSGAAASSSSSSSAAVTAAPKPVLTDAQQVAEDARMRGNEAFNKKDYAGAVEQYSQALMCGPHPESVHVCFTNRAFAFIKMKNYDEALVDVVRALENKATHSKAYYMGGLALVGQGRPWKAVEMFEKAGELAGKPKDKDMSLKKRDSAAAKGAAISDEEKAEIDAQVTQKRKARLQSLLSAVENIMAHPTQTGAQEEEMMKYNTAAPLLIQAVALSELDESTPVLRVDAIRLLARVHFLSRRFEIAGETYNLAITLAKKVLQADPDTPGLAASVQECQFFMAQALRTQNKPVFTKETISLLNEAMAGPQPSLVSKATRELIAVYTALRDAQDEGSEARQEFEALIVSLSQE